MTEIPKCVARQKSRLIPGMVRDVHDLEAFLFRFTQDVRLQPSMEFVSLRVGESKPGGKFCVTGWVAYPSQVKALETLLADSTLSEKIDLQVSVLPGETLRAIGFCACPEEVTGRCDPSRGSPVAHIWAAQDPIQPILKQSRWLLCRTENGYLAWIESPGENFFTNRLLKTGSPVQSRPHPRAVDESFLKGFLEAPYVWGGMSRNGVDCSGFTYRIYREMGIILPRDSHQQMLVGQYIAPSEDGSTFLPGDLLFFTHEDGRIGHVGYSLGGPRVIHAEEPFLTTFSLSPDDPDYNPARARHLVFGKRVLIPG